MDLGRQLQYLQEKNGKRRFESVLSLRSNEEVALSWINEHIISSRCFLYVEQINDYHEEVRSSYFTLNLTWEWLATVTTVAL
jgi:hypothetical protein